jgi:uncharacterized protein
VKIFYSTDMHGDQEKYSLSLKIAKELGCSVIINGGDLYPKSADLLKDGDIFNQDIFVNGFLDKYLEKVQKSGINYILCPGNDDLLRFDSLLNGVCEKYTNVHNADRNIITLDSYEFIGLSAVSDYPFQLKDRARKDIKNFVFEKQYGKGLLSTGKYRSWSVIEDWVAYSSTLPTMEQELNSLPKPSNMRRSVYIIHDPPEGTGLADVSHQRSVGSKAVLNFILENQPLLSLHGHVHESPGISGKWRADLGDTVAIQPGQENKILPCVIIELNGDKVKCEFFRVKV